MTITHLLLSEPYSPLIFMDQFGAVSQQKGYYPLLPLVQQKWAKEKETLPLFLLCSFRFCNFIHTSRLDSLCCITRWLLHSQHASTTQFTNPPLTNNLPETYNSLPESFTNYSYWQAPDISNVTGDVVAVLDDGGSFGIVFGEFSDGAVYVYKNDNDIGGLSATSNMRRRSAVFQRLSLETNGNIRLYRWDDVNGLRQWVPKWAAVSNPCDIAGICGNGVCNLDRSEINASCTCLLGTSKVEGRSQCLENSSLIGKCDSQHKYSTSEFRISTVQQTNYCYSYFSVIANYSDIAAVSKCGDACLSDCVCCFCLWA